MRIQEILDRLEGVKSQGGQYIARCPAHSDKKASLSVGVGDDGKILLNCFAGCSTENIVAALGLDMKDLFADDPKPATQPKQPTTRTKEAAYSYAGGQLKKIKYRYADGSKSCTWLHMEGREWKAGRKGISPGLYMSHREIPEAVFIVEGEKDVDTLKMMDLPAVSLPDGASSKWEDSYTEALKGRSVYILPDNDEPGRKYAELCARNLYTVANVWVVDLAKAWPEIPAKGDFSDMVAAMGSEAAYNSMYAALENTPKWTPPAEAEPEKPKPEKPGIMVTSAAALQAADLPPVKFLVEGILPAGTSILSAASKIGKSWMMLDMGLAIAAGVPFMGHNAERCGVLYLALEDSLTRLQERMNKILDGRTAPAGFLFAIEAPTLDTGLLDNLDTILEQYPDTKLIIIDTLQKIRGKALPRESSYEQDYREMGMVKSHMDKRGVSVLFVHHNRKMKDEDDPFNMISGTNGIMGAADTIWTIIKGKRSDNEATLHITGRDVMQSDTVISFDKSAWKWKPVGAVDLINAQRDKLAYDSDPVVKTIKELLKQQREWKGTAGELMDEGRRICKRPIAASAQALGYSLRNLDGQLLDYDGIIHDKTTRGGAGKKHYFYFQSWTDEADAQEELAM